MACTVYTGCEQAMCERNRNFRGIVELQSASGKELIGRLCTPIAGECVTDGDFVKVG